MRAADRTLALFRRSAPAMALAVLAWTAGCATKKPMIEPAFAARTYTPIRIAVLPPDVFVIHDQVGDNDSRRSNELSAMLAAELTRAVTAALQSRGYEVNLSSRWDGIVDPGGNLLVSYDEMRWLANSFLQFGNGPAGGGEGPMKDPAFVTPDLAAKVGWATASDAILYANVKGVTTSNGKRAAQIFGAVFFVLVVVAIALAIAASQKNGGGGGGARAPAGGGGGRAVSGGAPAWSGSAVGRGGAAVRPTPPLGAAPSAAPGGARWTPPAGRGPRPGGGGRVYGGGGPHVGIGIGFWVPIDGPEHTHDGAVGQEDDYFNGDELYVSLTLVNAADGRVLWHVRDSVDLDAEEARTADRLAQRFLGQLPLRGGLPEPGRK